ncbi:MAG: 2-phospho-L-lactate/phosphoenolpyruvate guanylyltransferase [Actinomycetota bacterium]|nr:2-phospho-L-lactate/phosphoenolpyruvate guanylyltransferase [Actinomycetota bacterium]
MSAGRLTQTAGVVVPLRSFALGKVRLAQALDDDARRALSRTMAERVVSAAGARPVVIVSSAPEVIEWTRALGVAQIPDPGTLDGAAVAGRGWVRDRGLARVVVMHADLPLATSLDGIADDAGAPIAVLVPDHHHDGNPVLSIPAAVDFSFGYGPDSCARHAAEARRLGLEVRIVEDHALGFDVDDESDLDILAHETPGPRSDETAGAAKKRST